MDCRASVIIPVYNAEKTLRRCVESLVLGLEHRIEVILCEDCSKDGSWELCLELAEEFPNVRCIRNERNSGVSHTRNRGLEAAQGSHILFVDSDDWVSRRYALELLEYADSEPGALVMCCLRFINRVENYRQDFYWDHNTQRVNYVYPDRFFDLAESFFIQSPCNKPFRRDVIEQHHIRFDESMSMGEDFQFVLDYMEAMQCKKCVVLNDPLYYYIRWNNSSLMSHFGFVQNQPEFARMAQLSRLAGPDSGPRRDAMIAQSKQNYVYHIVRNPSRSRPEKLEAIERILGDGRAAEHYRRQKLLHIKERTAALIGSAKKLYPRLRARMDRRQLQKRIARIKDGVRAEGVSILSQNCIGGVLYHDLGMQFLSPTVNTYIRQPDFVRFVGNLEHYLAQELVMRWEEEYPVGTLGDVEIHFMHYDTCREARESWQRRVQRLNRDKLLVLSTDRDGFDDAVYEQWKQIPCPKVLFTANPRFTEDAVYFPEFAQQGSVGDLISKRLFYRDGYLVNQIINVMHCAREE